MAKQKKTKTKHSRGISVSLTDLAAGIALAQELGLLTAAMNVLQGGDWQAAVIQVGNQVNTQTLVKIAIGTATYGIVKSFVPSKTFVKIGKFSLRT